MTMPGTLSPAALPLVRHTEACQHWHAMLGWTGQEWCMLGAMGALSA